MGKGKLYRIKDTAKFNDGFKYFPISNHPYFKAGEIVVAITRNECTWVVKRKDYTKKVNETWYRKRLIPTELFKVGRDLEEVKDELSQH